MHEKLPTVFFENPSAHGSHPDDVEFNVHPALHENVVVLQIAPIGQG